MDDLMRGASNARRISYYSGYGTLEQFYRITERSVFCLCPRGYGPTSFRTYEAIALGAIPVYIWSGEPWLPYIGELDWSSFSVILDAEHLASLPDLLLGHTPAQIAEKQRHMRGLYRKRFCMDAVCRYILRVCKGD